MDLHVLAIDSGDVLAVSFSRFGGPEVLEVGELPDPPLAAGHMRLRVAASTVNRSDTLFRAGELAGYIEAEPPWICGQEAAGTVDAVGAGSGFAVGDPVVTYSSWIPGGRGSHAELAVVPVHAVAPAPRNVSAAEAATLPMNGLTVRRALDLLRLPAGATLAVVGAAGAVGGYAVQLGSIEGLRVVAVAAPADEQLVRGLGADVFVPRGEEMAAAVRDAVPGGVDAVLDAARAGDAVVPLVRDGGSVAIVNNTLTEVPPRDIAVVRVSVQDYYGEQAKLADLVRLVDDGEADPPGRRDAAARTCIRGARTARARRHARSPRARLRGLTARRYHPAVLVRRAVVRRARRPIGASRPRRRSHAPAPAWSPLRSRRRRRVPMRSLRARARLRAVHGRLRIARAARPGRTPRR